MQSRLSPKLRCLTDYLILLLIIFFIVQSLLKFLEFDTSILRFFGFSSSGISSGFIWTIATYAFLHEGPFHLLFNILGIHFISRNVEETLHRDRYIILFLTSVTFGSIFWFFFNSHNGFLIGTSAFVMASLTLFCLQKPNTPITFLLFFVIPLSLKPKYILYGVLGLEIYGFVFSELQNTGNIAHTAHLGGMLAGFIQSSSLFNSFSLPKLSFRLFNEKYGGNKKSHTTKEYTINHELPSDLEIQVDKVLDKINEKGFGCLTDEEKALLEKAKSLFNSKHK